MSDQSALIELSKTRAQQDAKALKKSIRDLYRLATPGLTGEELLAAHESFLLGLDALGQHLGRTARLEQLAEVEVEAYERQQREIDATQGETQAKLVLLQDQLVQAQAARVKKIEYDKRAKQINKLPDRTKGAESLAKLHEDIAVLEAEKSTYADRWSSRSTEFGAIVSALARLSSAIKEENREQERRRALDEDDDQQPDEQQHTALDPFAKEFRPAAQGETEGSSPLDEDAEGEVPGDEAMEGVELEEGEEGEQR